MFSLSECQLKFSPEQTGPNSVHLKVLFSKASVNDASGTAAAVRVAFRDKPRIKNFDSEWSIPEEPWSYVMMMFYIAKRIELIL